MRPKTAPGAVPSEAWPWTSHVWQETGKTHQENMQMWLMAGPVCGVAVWSTDLQQTRERVYFMQYNSCLCQLGWSQPYQREHEL